MHLGTFYVYSPCGGEILAQFHYRDGYERTEAKERARVERLRQKERRDRVGIREHKWPQAKA